ncbi:MAG: gamma-glutamylcyclotransferase [Rhizobacter sp.]|nr:gamma-glutamylcyclotransferase [Rhizobacter sp.]
MTASATFVNFAYGSNMSTRRLRQRTPSARPVGVGQLGGHRLMWHKIGQDGSAKCDILETGRPHDIVWGVLFEIALADRPSLDRAEGLGNGYEHKSVSVLTDAGMQAAGAYYATHIDANLRPFDWYLAFVLQGAHEHGLPAHYLASIESVGAVVDTDIDRRERNFALLRDL